MNTPMPRASPGTKIRASLYGLAICDALGGPAEFHQRDSFPLITTFLPNHSFSLPAGSWTDDTSLTLCLSHSLTTLRRFSPAHQAAAFVRWYRAGFLSVTGECFDIGGATRAALELWARSRDAALTGALVRAQVGGERHCGNGSLMRIAPVAWGYWRCGVEVAERRAREAGEVTHPHPLCGDACAVYTRLLVMVLQGGCTKEGLVEAAVRFGVTSDRLGPVLTREALLEWDRKKVRSTGYVLHTLHAALWCFFGTESFEEGAVMAVNLGGDADTVAAVYGGLAGAWYAVDAEEGAWWGEGNVRGWWDGLEGKDMLREEAERIVLLDADGGLTEVEQE
ncbi:putative ADP-ribosylglycohydrolase [Geopyxis carbonaria]|nr:putative ADP-ribosylglycohydrolase [Geopyxis carbonaria]